jgi:hypothetical protein
MTFSYFSFYKGEMMVHYYYIDHSKQQSSGQSESSEPSNNNNQQPSFSPSSEVLHGNFFLLGQSVWIICQLLGKIIYIFFSIKNKYFSFIV